MSQKPILNVIIDMIAVLLTSLAAGLLLDGSYSPIAGLRDCGGNAILLSGLLSFLMRHRIRVPIVGAVSFIFLLSTMVVFMIHSGLIDLLNEVSSSVDLTEVVQDAVLILGYLIFFNILFVPFQSVVKYRSGLLAQLSGSSILGGTFLTYVFLDSSVLNVGPLVFELSIPGVGLAVTLSSIWNLTSWDKRFNNTWLNAQLNSIQFRVNSLAIQIEHHKMEFFGVIIIASMAGFDWMMPASTRHNPDIITTIDLLALGFCVSLMVGHRWRSHYITGTLAVMLIPTLSVLIVTNFIELSHAVGIDWLIIYNSFGEVVAWTLLIALIAGILATYFFIPRLHRPWTAFGTFVVLYGWAALFDTTVIDLGYLKFDLIVSIVLASVAVGAWIDTPDGSDGTSEKSIANQIRRLMGSSETIKVYPLGLMILFLVGVFFGSAWYREYANLRSFRLNRELIHAKSKMKEEAEHELTRDSVSNLIR